MGEYKEKIKKPYFSVILPIYNVEAYLRDCVESVLSQDFEDYELILVDDGADDGCPEICDEYAQKDSRIKVVHKENGGLSSARNAGLDVAQGEYIWWVDSDDWIEEGALRRLWSVSREAMPDIVKFNYCREGQSKEEIIQLVESGKYTRKKGLEPVVDKAFFCARAFCLSVCSHIYRRDFLGKNALSFVSERLVGSEDYLFNLQALPLIDSAAVIDDVLYRYRLRSNSLSQNYRDDLPERYNRLCELLREHYRKVGKYALFEDKLNFFYVWHLMFGTCMVRAYLLGDAKDLKKRRESVKRLLNSAQFQTALANGAGTGLDWKRGIKYLAMRMKIEPFFYWLLVTKAEKGTKQV